MKRTTLAKIGVAIGALLAAIAGLHLVGNSLMPMIKTHMGL